MRGPQAHPMDIIKVLRELHAERKRLDAVIATLEAQSRGGRQSNGAGKTPGRRGRKSMSPAERLKVSKRMTLYWESRRAQVRELETAGQQSSSTAAP
jgi:hypothetical protein